jgi:crotonobetainyl-CoA:carnitine CoA-transferase CaiB-like acyl-CoA transferase
MGPLDGTKVLDFTHGVAGPFTTMLLGDLGADVVKVERPGRGDPTRYMNVSGRFLDDIPRSGGDYFLAINRNKRAVTIDLQSARGHDLAVRLAGWADVVVQNFRPGVMSRLGLDYDALREVRPELIYATLSAYGEHGPLARQPGMDVAVQARSGVMSITGYGGSDPVKPGVSLADFSGGAHLATGILGALLHRARTGRGQEIHVSLLDATMIMLANYSVAVVDGDAEIAPMGSGHPQLVPFQAFPTSDGFIVIATGTNKLYRELCRTLGLDHLTTDERFATNPDRVRHREELIRLLGEVTMRRSTAEWQELFESRQIPSAPVNGLDDALRDPQLLENDMVVEVEHPELGPIHVLGVPYKYSEASCSVRRPPPLLGEQTDEVLAEVLELDAGEIESLREERVI